jgi:hypothetical protein
MRPRRSDGNPCRSRSSRGATAGARRASLRGQGAVERAGGRAVAGGELEHAIRPADERQRDVPHAHAARRDAALAAAVAWPHDEVGARVVDRLRQQIASEERIDLEPLPWSVSGIGE